MSKSAKRKPHDAKKRGDVYVPPVAQTASTARSPTMPEAPPLAQNDRWSQPRPENVIRWAGFTPFGVGVIGELLPTEAEIPAEFGYRSNPWNIIASAWFVRGHGMSEQDFKCRPGIDRSTAAMQIRGCLLSLEPVAEHKIAGVAYLASRWFVAP